MLVLLWPEEAGKETNTWNNSANDRTCNNHNKEPSAAGTWFVEDWQDVVECG